MSSGGAGSGCAGWRHHSAQSGRFHGIGAGGFWEEPNTWTLLPPKPAKWKQLTTLMARSRHIFFLSNGVPEWNQTWHWRGDPKLGLINLKPPPKTFILVCWNTIAGPKINPIEFWPLRYNRAITRNIYRGPLEWSYWSLLSRIFPWGPLPSLPAPQHQMLLPSHPSTPGEYAAMNSTSYLADKIRIFTI